MLAKPGLEIRKDHFLCFSPERVGSGNASYKNAEYPEDCRGSHAGVHGNGAVVYSEAVQTISDLDKSRGNVKLLENNATGDQYRPGENEIADVRSYRQRTCGK